MRKLLLAAVLGALAVTGPVATPSEARSQKEKTAQQFEALWRQRLDDYRRQAGDVGAKHKAAFEALAAKPFEFAEGDDRLRNFIRASDDDAYVSGKGQELEAFLSQVKGRPSLGLLQAYLQGRISAITDLLAEVEGKRQDMLAIAKRPNVRFADLYAAIEAASMARGDAQGRSEELKLIIENFGSYASEYAAASERDIENRARWAAALGAIGRSLSQQQQQYQQHFTTCMATGSNMVSCSGN